MADKCPFGFGAEPPGSDPARAPHPEPVHPSHDDLWSSEERFKSVVNHVIDGIISINEQAIILSFNPAAEKLFGYHADEVMGHNVSMLMPEPYKSQHDGYVHRYIETGERRIIGIGREVLGRRKDGSIFPMELAVSEFHLGGRRYFTGIVRDITERKRLEEELLQRAEELAAADKRKDEFLAMLAHELRNPLAPIVNALEIMRLRRVQDPVVEQARQILERQARQMTSLVDDLLDISRIIKGKISLRQERVNVLLIVRNAIEATRHFVEERQQHLELTQPPQPTWLEGDPTRLEQVLINLLANASKYTDPGGWIGLTVEWGPPEPNSPHGTVAIRVRDTGMGIAPEMLPRIFDMYAQAEPSARRTLGGMGIGLTLARDLVQMHGGHIEAHSEGLGKGSEFIVRLSAAEPPTEVPAPEPAAEDQPSHPEGARSVNLEGMRCRVLVVDDDVDSSRSMGELLEIWGHEIRLAHEGPAALEIARQYRPDVMLLDIQMPGMDGYQVARNLRSDASLRRMVLVALTGYGQEEDRRKTREAGFDYHFTKPVDLEGLHRLLDRVSGH